MNFQFQEQKLLKSYASRQQTDNEHQAHIYSSDGHSVDILQGDYQTFPTALQDQPDDKFELLSHCEEDQQQKKEESSVHVQWSS